MKVKSIPPKIGSIDRSPHKLLLRATSWLTFATAICICYRSLLKRLVAMSIVAMSILPLVAHADILFLDDLAPTNSNPTGIAVDDTTNSIYVSRQSENTTRYDKEGNVFATFSFGYRVDVGPGGNVFTVDDSGIRKHQFNGSILDEVAGGGQWDIAVSPNHDVFTSRGISPRYNEFDSDLNFVDTRGLNEQYYAIGASEFGLYVVTSFGEVRRYGTSGPQGVFSNSASLAAAEGETTGIDFNSKGDVYVVQGIAGEIRKYTSGLDLIETTSVGSTSFDVAVSNTGHVYLADVSAEMIKRYFDFDAWGDDATVQLSGQTASLSNSITMPDGATLEGTGSLDTPVDSPFTTSTIRANGGTLTLGSSSSLIGFSTAGQTIVEDGSTLHLDSLGFANLGNLTTIYGAGILEAPNGIVLSSGDNMQASGTVNAAISAANGSTIVATGTLAMGDSSVSDGFFSDGRLYVNEHTVTINDSNAAVLPSLTKLGTGTAEGQLSAPNGMLLEEGKNLVGRGTVSGDFKNQGEVIGDADEDNKRIVFDTGFEVSGIGSFLNVDFLGDFNPGNSPGSVDVEDITLGDGSTLNIELGGTVAGDEYDQLNSLGTLTLEGNLGVSLINSFALDLGQQFTIVDNEGTIDGEFFGLSQGDLVGNIGGVDLYITYAGGDGNDVVLFTSSGSAGVPEPSTLTLAALGFLVLIRRRRRK